MKNQKGFSLIELLVVVIIIAIIAAIAIPSLLASRRAASEAAAISALRTIVSANATYQATAGGGVNYASLGDLNSTGGLIDATLAAGNKGGYAFAMAGPADAAPGATYCVSADPTDTAMRAFAVAADGVIYQYAAGTAADCTGAGDTVSGGTVLGN
jgi:type IV pilus assembly protein PilA